MEDKNSLAWDLIKDRDILVNRLIKAMVVIVIIMSLLVAGIVGAFVWYLNQYDFTSTTETTTIEATTYDNGDATAILNSKGEVLINGESENNCDEENEE